MDELTLSEKLTLVHGAVDPDGEATGYVPGIERLDVPPLRLVDGPLGVRTIRETATAFPASIALAASWNPQLAREFGTALTRETVAANQDVILAPGVNIIRVPTGGWNFEYYSEDPHLSTMVETSVFDGDEDRGTVNMNIDDAVVAADAADDAVVVVQDDASEFVDRDEMALPGRQDELVSTVADVADRTVVVLRTSGPVKMPWLEQVDAVLQTWYPGQADGDALGVLLIGDGDPGGQLPVTFGRSAGDYPMADERSYPGVDDVARYDEGVFVGYRYFDGEDIEPLFPFGHGRSYAISHTGSRPSLLDPIGGRFRPRFTTGATVPEPK